MLGSAPLAQGTAGDTVISIPVTPAVWAWRWGQPNHGLLLKVQNEAFEGRDLRFYSKTEADASRHPYIEVWCS